MTPTEPDNPLASRPRLRLYLIRHGKAERNSATGEDEDRKLKGRGERQAAFIGERLAKERHTLGALVHSPVLRAAQTAKVLAKACGCRPQEEPSLAVDEGPRKMTAVIEKHRAAGALAIVAHNPTLEAVAAGLAPRQFKTTPVNLRTGEVLVFDIAEGRSLSEGSLVGRWRLDDEDD
ncbi:MAG: SixA phosphatase family protein [Phycisphaerales bacterium]